MPSPIQFDWKRNWSRVMPLLRKRHVLMAQNFGLGLNKEGNHSYGDPPWQSGRLSGDQPKEGSLAWYQPWGCCHLIAPFAWAIGRELYPELRFGFVTSDDHTVAVGYREEIQKPELVLDILLFDEKSAEESLAFAGRNRAVHTCLCSYLASFCSTMTKEVKELVKVTVGCPCALPAYSDKSSQANQKPKKGKAK